MRCESHRVAILLKTDEGATIVFETAEGTTPSVATATCAATALAAARAAMTLGRAASSVLTTAHAASTVVHHCRPSFFVFAPGTQKYEIKWSFLFKQVNFVSETRHFRISI